MLQKFAAMRRKINNDLTWERTSSPIFHPIL